MVPTNNPLTKKGELAESGDTAGLAAFVGVSEAAGRAQSNLLQEPSQLEMSWKVSQGALPSNNIPEEMESPHLPPACSAHCHTYFVTFMTKHRTCPWASSRPLTGEETEEARSSWDPQILLRAPQDCLYNGGDVFTLEDCFLLKTLVLKNLQ